MTLPGRGTAADHVEVSRMCPERRRIVSRDVRAGSRYNVIQMVRDTATSAA
jgi:hypothetical protein